MKTINVLFLILLTIHFTFAQVDLKRGLVLDLPFNGNANDVTASFLTGQVHNAVLTYDRFGIPNSAYGFNGINSFIRFPHIAAIDFGPTEDFTISMWVKIPANQNDDQSAQNHLISKWIDRNTGFPSGSTSGYPYGIRLDNQTATDNGKISLRRWDGYPDHGGCANISTISTYDGPQQQPQTYCDDVWHHFVFRKLRSNGPLQLMVDGIDYGQQPDHSGTSTTNITCTTKSYAELIIGARNDEKRLFTGVMDDIKIWNRSLNEAEMQTFANPTAIDNSFPASLRVGPNPAYGLLAVEWSEYIIQDISLVDMTSREIPSEITFDRHQGTVKTNYQGLAFLKIRSGKGTLVRKIIFE